MHLYHTSPFYSYPVFIDTVAVILFSILLELRCWHITWCCAVAIEQSEHDGFKEEFNVCISCKKVKQLGTLSSFISPLS